MLIVASSGIVVILLDGGRTTHSRFHIPLNVSKDDICGIKQNTHAVE